MGEKIKGIAIVPGSFDPITNGHIDIVRRAVQRYDKVYLAVMINSEKKYMFTLEQRRRIAEAAVADIEGVEVISSEGYLWKLARTLGACAIVKGVRNEVDREYELKMAEYNSAHNPEAQTVLLETAPELAHISSTLVRERLARGEDILGLLPEGAAREIEKIIGEMN
ncbi:MAG: pantetheine-phosphate adenylyltransferase [Clostridia bacterium]|nr:pantetheine-phosphate adenylyltransferase [Clostridia bacterium]